MVLIMVNTIDLYLFLIIIRLNINVRAQLKTLITLRSKSSYLIYKPFLKMPQYIAILNLDLLFILFDQ